MAGGSRFALGCAASDSSVFPAKFPDISRFCGHPELLHLRKIHFDNSSSFVQALCTVICLNILCDRMIQLQQNSFLRDGHGLGTSMGWVKLGESVLIFFIYILVSNIARNIKRALNSVIQF